MKSFLTVAFLSMALFANNASLNASETSNPIVPLVEVKPEGIFAISKQALSDATTLSIKFVGNNKYYIVGGVTITAATFALMYKYCPWFKKFVDGQKANATKKMAANPSRVY